MNTGGGLEDATEDDLEQMLDISIGKEPVPIKVEGIRDAAIVHLQRTFREYLTDSILADGTPLSNAAVPQQDSSANSDHSIEGSSPESDEESVDEAESRGCDCDGLPSLCSVVDGDTCDCVQQFGNFYSNDVVNANPSLNLDAIPTRMPLVECGDDCRCGSTCANRTTQRGVRVQIIVRESSAGLGAFLSPLSALIPKGTFIALYAGEYLSTSEARGRWRANPMDNYTLSLRLSGQIIHIDPRNRGNVGRFLNHSCDPNCAILIVYWGSSWPRAAIFTRRDVVPGEELTFDYGNASGQAGPLGANSLETVAESAGRTKCLCGTRLCRGYMPFDETL